MAQGDLFSRLYDKKTNQNQSKSDFELALQKNFTSDTKRLEIIGEIYTREINIARVRKQMLESDEKTLNIYKRISNVTGKIFNQIKENKDLSKKMVENEESILLIGKQIQIAKREGNKEIVNALNRQRRQMLLDKELNQIALEQKRKAIPVLGKIYEKNQKIGLALMEISEGASNLVEKFKMIKEALNPVFGILGKIGGFFVNIIKKVFQTFLEIQSSVGNLAADIGLTAEQSNRLLNNFASLSISASKFGGTIKDVAQLMQQFSETTNKNRIFDKEEVEQLIELGLGTGLGVQGAAELAGSFDNIGISLEKTIKLTDKARNLAAKYNVNTTKVLNTYQGLVKSLTGIGFGKGLDNLTKLAAKATAIRFDIVKSTEAFADAFFDPEKAVEASAQMQVLGGKFAASFGDPMQLAFESMTDPSALAEKFAATVSDIVAKDSKGNYFIPPAERKMLKIAAETLGQSYEDAVATAIEQKKMAEKMAAINKSGISLVSFTEEQRLALSGLMTLNKDNKYEIQMSDGTTKLLENITDKNQLKAILDARKKNEDAAIQRKNLMERLEMIGNRFMLGFSNIFTKLFGSTDFESFLQMVEAGGTKLAEFIGTQIMGSDGLTAQFQKLIGWAQDVFLKIQDIFQDDSKTLMQKVTATLSALFRDVLIQTIKFLAPIFKAGVAELLHIIGGALPEKFGGKALQNYAAKVRAEAVAADQTGLLRDMYEGVGTSVAPAPPQEKSTDLMGTTGRAIGGVYSAKALSSKVGIQATGKIIEKAGEHGFNLFYKSAPRIAEKAIDVSGFGAKIAAKGLSKKLPIIGGLIGLGLAAKDFMAGDYGKAGLGLTSAALNIGGSLSTMTGIGASWGVPMYAASLAIDAGMVADDLGAFDDGVIYKDGSYAKFNKGDMVQFIDQAAMERAMSTQNSPNGGNGNIQHSGVITIKSDDGKVVTWDQMYNARDLIGARMSSINESYENGFGDYQNPRNAPIKPLL